MKSMQLFILTFILLVSINICAQECENCDRPSDVKLYQIDMQSIQEPQDALMHSEWTRLSALTGEIDYLFHVSGMQCVYVSHISGEGGLDSEAEYRLNTKWAIMGNVSQRNDDYLLSLTVEPICSDKTLAKVEIPFQLYPKFDLDAVAGEAYKQLKESLDNIAAWELQERERTKRPISRKGEISMYADNWTITPGSQTKIMLVMHDCDMRVLKNQEINLSATGGIFTPAKVITNENGTAETIFKLTSAKAKLTAKSVTKDVHGCESIFTGNTSFEPGVVEVTIEYVEEERRAADPSKVNPFNNIKVSGGQEHEYINVIHRVKFIQRPSPESLKKGFLVFEEKTGIEGYGSATLDYYYDEGLGMFTETVKGKEVTTTVGDRELKDYEAGSDMVRKGLAPPRAASIEFFMGDESNPPYFSFLVTYPVADDHIVSGNVIVVKEKETKEAIRIKNITDPKSPFKTEYTIRYFIDYDLEQKMPVLGVYMDQHVIERSGYAFLKATIRSPFVNKWKDKEE
jgi:hypothetical protein